MNIQKINLMKIKHFLFLFVLIFLSSSALFSQQKVEIKGEIKGENSFTNVILTNLISEEKLDSCQLSTQSTFELSTSIAKQGFYKLLFSNDFYILLVLMPGEKVEIEIEEDRFYQPQIKGSPNSALIYQISNQLNDFEIKIREFKEKIEKEKQEYLKETINKNLNSLACMVFLENLDIENNYDLLKKLDNTLYKTHSDNFLVSELHQNLSNIEILKKGQPAPDINLPTLEGKKLSLSSFRGKVVLIDFWASWCGPCLREVPNLRKAYEKYKSKGFDIYSVSLDIQKDKWEKAIEKHRMTWNHVSDLKGWESPLVQTYGIKGIPFTVLLDKDGKIIAKMLRGDEIIKILDQIFK